MITYPHYHIIVWKDSKNLGKVTLCKSRNCVLEPAFNNDEFPELINV